MPDNMAEKLADEFTFRDLQLARVAESERRKIFAMLSDVQADVLEQIRRIDPTEPGRLTFKQRRLLKLQLEVGKILSAGYIQIWREQRDQLRALSEAEAAAAANIVNGQITTDFLRTIPATPVLRKLVDETLIEGGPAREWWKQQGDVTTAEFTRQMRIGISEGETLSQLLQRVRGTRAAGFKDGITGISRRSAERIIRTSIASVSNAARQQVYLDNQDVLRGVQAVAVLDTRTSHICKARSGGAWNPVTRRPLPGSPVQTRYPGPPPWHWNCVLPGTMIATKQGWRSIETLSIDDEVLTHNGRFRRITAIAQKTKQQRVTRRLKTKSGRILRTSNDHPVLTVGRGWQRAGDIQVGDKIVEYKKQTVKAHGSKVPLVEADNSPSFLDQCDVTDEIFRLLFSPIMGLTVNFERDEMGWIGKIQNPSVNGVLKKWSDVAFFEQPQHYSFMSGRISSEIGSSLFHDTTEDAGVMRGVISFPAFTGLFIGGTGVFGQSIGPMFRSGWMFPLLCGNDRCLFTVSRFDSVFPAPPTQTVIRKSILTLDFSQRTPIGPMFGFDESSKTLFVRKGNSHNETPCGLDEYVYSDIISTAEENSNDFLYDISVEDDETYFADGILVHNCRTTLIYVPLPVESIDKRLDDIGPGTQASMDGQVSGDLTFEGWLSRQSESRQREALGPGRLELWRKGKISMTDLINQRGRPLTLEELNAI